MILMPSAAYTASMDPLNFVARSQMRDLTATARSESSTQMLRARWVTHSVDGLAVTPAIRTIRVSWWMKKST